MLPATNRGAGGNLCFPDVCLTPPTGVPVPYVNIALDAAAVPFCVKTYFTFVNGLNQGSVVPLTLGDQAGAMSPFMGPGMVTVGNPKIFLEGLPAKNLTCPATGNNGIAFGASLLPSVTNVFFTYSDGPGASELDREALSGLLRALGPGQEEMTRALLPGDVAYLKVPVFSAGLPARVFDLVRRASSGDSSLAPGGDPALARSGGSSSAGAGLRLLVLDLRGCPGGKLMAAVELAGDFLPEGAEVATLVDADGDETVYRSRSEQPYSMPVVVLVDRGTASAAEVFAGALQAHGRAVVVGERTFGKGVAQQVLPGAAGPGAHYATVASVRLPGGRVLQGAGVTPDVEGVRSP